MKNPARPASWSTPRPGPAAASAALALLLAPALAWASVPGVSLSKPWLRFLTPQIPAAGYFTLSNGTDHAMVLTGAASQDCGTLMLHQSVVENGTAQMKMVPDVVVPPHGSVTFQPGGYHLMCVSPAAAIHPGAHVPVMLKFKDGSTVDADFPVYGAKGP